MRKTRWLPILFSAALSSFAGHAQPTRGQGQRPTPASLGPNGNYYALVIGINDYHPPLKHLNTAVHDAQEIAQVLRDTYGFNVQTLTNAEATHDRILDAIAKYRNQLNPEDSLLIYYAGHGHKDREADKSYWLPVDVDPDPEITSHWIISDELTTLIKVQKARHVLIVSDSCYSGGLSRGDETPTGSGGNYLNRMVGGTSRTLMSSGGEEPVADGGAEGHSIFAFAVLKALKDEAQPAVTAHDLFYSSIQRRVSNSSDQVPQYAAIRNSMRNPNDEEGDFVFVRREAIVHSTSTVESVPPAPTRPASVPAMSPSQPIPAAAAVEISHLVTSTPSPLTKADADLAQKAIALYNSGNFVEAFPLLTQACAADDAYGCAYLGNSYRLGRGVAPDIGLARRYLGESCNAGNALGCALHDSAGTGSSPANSQTKADPAVAQKGIALYNGGRYAEAIPLLTQACDGRDGLGCAYLGNIYRLGKGVPADINLARQYLQKSCDSGNSLGCTFLAYL